MTVTPLPARQALYLCATADCGLVYYGAAGARILADALRLCPVWKGGDVLCFCFGHRVEELLPTDGRAGESDLIREISRRVAAGDCACDLRNPSGRCCLQEIRRAISQGAQDARQRHELT